MVKDTRDRREYHKQYRLLNAAKCRAADRAKYHARTATQVERDRKRNRENMRARLADPVKRAELKAQQLGYRESRVKTPERLATEAATARAWREANPERFRKAVLNRKAHIKRYGLTPSDYDRMLEAQGGKCAICRQPETFRRKDGSPMHLAVDHCHTTGRVRGLLCRMCNQTLGRVKDSVELLQASIDYLRKNQP